MHGMQWKNAYIERHLQEYLENVEVIFYFYKVLVILNFTCNLLEHGWSHCEGTDDWNASFGELLGTQSQNTGNEMLFGSQYHHALFALNHKFRPRLWDKTCRFFI